ncbi:hypothetical protein [Candidatus Nitrosocosmicus sp. SS]|jgi:hypothetical protein|uniref:hypothetical protein n=1 Tax=Candidatus Nitrosocosmicus agrestis TaxID=2563600 RepID=UPI00122DEDB5|nr:hypothetical protein [Candidatus Nitrosocosmicus sp. SS]KAA2283356.1 hypothetical protein F1Z66_02355 [Candidatus Nitrosocosmicus sp. SS]KAF0868998.1 hypothetical protein E5N71_08375 [Candidatus Nitrosocosmicus sp. SS]
MTSDIQRARWGSRFIISAIAQGGILTSFAIFFIVSQFIFSNKLDMIQFLSLSFDGPAKWFFLGIIFYLIFIVAIAVTAIFYIQLEINLQRKLSKFINALVWIHLFGMNIGGPLATILMIFAGLAGSGILSVFSGGDIGPEDVNIMTSFITPIAISISILSLGVISGGVAYIKTFFISKRV